METQKRTGNPIAFLLSIGNPGPRKTVPPSDKSTATVHLSMKYKIPNQAARNVNFHRYTEHSNHQEAGKGSIQAMPKHNQIRT